MEIFAKITSEQEPDNYIKELQHVIRLDHILNINENIQIVGCNYCVIKRLIHSYNDTKKFLPFVELILMPIENQTKVIHYSTLYAKISIKSFREGKDGLTVILNIEEETTIEDFVSIIIPNSEWDFIKIKDGDYSDANDLYCQFKNIKNILNSDNRSTKTILNVLNHKITKMDLRKLH